MESQILSNLISFVKPEDLMPHGQCLLWKPSLLGLHVLSDLSIVLAYYSIPLALVKLVRKRDDLTFGWIFILFGLFIFLCGTTHLVSVVTIWKPIYWVDGLLKFVTGIVSVATAILLWPLVNKALKLPSAAELERVNEELVQKIEEKKQAEDALRLASDNLEKMVDARTTELEKTNQSLKREIQEKELAEDKLKESKKRLEMIFESGMDAIVAIDEEGKILEWNRQAETIFGWSEDQVIGKELSNTIIPQRYREAHLSGITRFLKTGESKILNSRIEIEALDIASNEIPIELTIAYSDSKEKNFIAFLSDITSRKKAEKELIQAKEYAEKSNQAKTEFLARMSHELRTPMNAILGFGQLLEVDKEHPLDEKQKSHIKRILKSGNHLLNLINEVLDLSKVESGSMDLSLENVNVNAISHEVNSVLCFLAEEAQVSLEFASNKEIYAFADYIRLKQVLLNIVSNSIKYNKTGGSVVIDFKYDKKKTLISISDTGTGIPEEKQSQIFQPFTRVAANPDEIEGTGIGLTITKRLVEKMNGKVSFKSIYHEGTTFFIELPRGERTENILEKSEAAVTKVVTPFKNNKRCILYIEDNPDNLDLVEQILAKRPDIALISAANAEEGIEIAKETIPDLIIMDIHLPGMDGLTAFQRLKTFEETNSIPIVALSADAMQTDKNKALALGFNSYLTKPLRLIEFLETIDKYLI